MAQRSQLGEEGLGARAAPAPGPVQTPSAFQLKNGYDLVCVRRVIVPNFHSGAVCVLSYQRNFPFCLLREEWITTCGKISASFEIERASSWPSPLLVQSACEMFKDSLLLITSLSVQWFHSLDMFSVFPFYL